MNSKTKRVTTIGMLCAITYATMVVGRIPIILFLKYDPSDVIVTFPYVEKTLSSCLDDIPLLRAVHEKPCVLEL